MDRVLAQNELGSDLGVREPCRNEPDDLALALAEHVRRLRPGLRLDEHPLDQAPGLDRIKLPATLECGFGSPSAKLAAQPLLRVPERPSVEGVKGDPGRRQFGVREAAQGGGCRARRVLGRRRDEAASAIARW